MRALPICTCRHSRHTDDNHWGFKTGVFFALDQRATVDGWTVQEVNVRFRTWVKNPGDAKPTYYRNQLTIADGNEEKRIEMDQTHYWEAWPVPAGAAVAYRPPMHGGRPVSEMSIPDEYMVVPDTDRGEDRSRGEVKILGTVAFYEGRLPDELKWGAVSSAPALPATTTRPDFWTGTGTAHHCLVNWNYLASGSRRSYRLEPAAHDKSSQAVGAPQKKFNWHEW